VQGNSQGSLFEVIVRSHCKR